MAILLASVGILLAFAGAVGPGVMFLSPRLAPRFWYRLGRRRTALVGVGTLLLIAAVFYNRDLVWLLVFVPLLAALRAVLRPERVIRALDEPRLLPAEEADLPPDNFVLAVVVSELPRAWPREILIAHHLIHDRVGETPVLASW